MKSAVVIAYDLETTSRSTESDIIQMCFILYRANNSGISPMRVSFKCNVKPRKRIEIGAQNVHGISRSSLIQENYFEVAIEKMRSWLLKHGKGDKTIFLSYNGSKFDDVVLANNIFRHCKSMYTIAKFFDLIGCVGFFDLYAYIRTYYLERDIDCPRDTNTDRPSLTLSNCVRQLCNKNLDNAHDAEADCRAMYDIMQKLDCKMHLMSLLVDMKSVRSFIDTLPFVMQGKNAYRTLSLAKATCLPSNTSSPSTSSSSSSSNMSLNQSNQRNVERTRNMNPSPGSCDHIIIPDAGVCFLCNSIVYNAFSIKD